MHDKLGDLMFANDPRLMTKWKEYIAKMMEKVAVIKVAVGIKIAELMSLHQDHNKPIRTFATLIWSKAETFNFAAVSECKCEKMLQVIQRKQLK